VHRPCTEGSLDSFPVIQSSELVQLYGVETVQKPFVFEGPFDQPVEARSVPPGVER
jgi:hypothetical protein